MYPKKVSTHVHNDTIKFKFNIGLTLQNGDVVMTSFPFRIRKKCPNKIKNINRLMDPCNSWYAFLHV